MTLYFVDDVGNYLGGFDGAPPPAGAIQVPTAPDNAAQKWDGTKWLPLTPSRQQLAGQAFAAGCQIVSNSTAALSATYAIMPQDEINWTGIQSAINANQPWPGYIRDINGIKKVVGAAQATAVLDAILQYIAGIDQYVHGEVAALPAQPVMIA